MDIEEKFRMRTPIGVIEIKASLSGIHEITFLDNLEEVSPNPPELHVTKETRDQITAYFDGRLLRFDVPLKYNGTEFQEHVWESLRAVPYGRTTTALKIARQFGDARIIRSITPSISRNPIPILIPCHRIVGKNGNLTNYRWGLYRKKHLVELEHPFKQGVLF
ncbi:MAG: methylated-DNA-[protein]-cysteine S-methyltransferase [Sphingobacteriales bacterium]|jgi:methylated-DNA-[protein]-cysteine S-methyltransferase